MAHIATMPIQIISTVSQYTPPLQLAVESSWNVMAHGDARERKWRGNWRMEWVASTLHTTSEHGVSSITTADAHTSAASTRLNWRPRRFKWTRPFRTKDEIWFLRVCHHISNVVYDNNSLTAHSHKLQMLVRCYVFTTPKKLKKTAKHNSSK